MSTRTGTETLPGSNWKKIIGIHLIIIGLVILGYMLVHPAESLFRYLVTGGLTVIAGVFLYSEVRFTLKATAPANTPSLASDLTAEVRSRGLNAATETLPDAPICITHIWWPNDFSTMILHLDLPGVLIKKRGLVSEQSLTDLDGYPLSYEYDLILKAHAHKTKSNPVIWVDTKSRDGTRVYRLNNGVTVIQSDVNTMLNQLKMLD